MATSVYVLRHAQPSPGDSPNRERPLSDLGRQQAQALVPCLRALGCTAVYSSPFARAVATVQPYCDAAGVPLHLWERLAENQADEILSQVRGRMVQAVTEIAHAHPGERVILCTHGGNVWGLLSAFDSSFDYEQYRRLGTPDMRLLHWQENTGTLDANFRFVAPLTETGG